MTKEVEIGPLEKRTNVLKGAESIYEFFGVSSNKIDVFNFYIALHGKQPEWLRGIPKETDLPRRIMSNDLPFRFVCPNSEEGRAKLANWIVQTLENGWNINNRFVLFDSEIDAIHYEMTWDTGELDI